VAVVDQVAQVKLAEPVELAVVEILHYVFQQEMQHLIQEVVVLELFNLLALLQVVMVVRV
jgi:hypothetical protein